MSLAATTTTKTAPKWCCIYARGGVLLEFSFLFGHHHGRPSTTDVIAYLSADVSAYLSAQSTSDVIAYLHAQYQYTSDASAYLRAQSTSDDTTAHSTSDVITNGQSTSDEIR